MGRKYAIAHRATTATRPMPSLTRLLGLFLMLTARPTMMIAATAIAIITKAMTTAQLDAAQDVDHAVADATKTRL